MPGAGGPPGCSCRRGHRGCVTAGTACGRVHANFRRRVWLPALAASGLDIHFRDLRHTGNTLVAEAGANLRELMERMGHSTSRAALIYLHSTSERQHMLADAVAARVQSELGMAAEDA